MATKQGVMVSACPNLDKAGDEELVPHLDADKVMGRLGSGGAPQIAAVALLNTCWLIYTFHTLMHAFVTATPAFACVQADFEPDGNETAEFFARNCYFNATEEMANNTEVCGSDNRTKYYFDPNGDYTQAVEWTMVSECSAKGGHWLQMGSSLYMIGSLCSMLFMAQLSDIFGRKVTLTTCMWLSGLVGALCALSPDFTTFVALRVVLGALSVGISNVAWVYTAELLSMRGRAALPVYVNVIWNVGYCGAGALAMHIRNWRTLTAVSSLPFVLAVSFYWLLPESLHWLIARGRAAQTLAWIGRAERANRTEVDLRRHLRDDCGSGRFHGPKRRNLLSVVKSPALTFHMAIFSYLTMVTCLVYWGLSLFSTRLSEDRFLGFFLSGLIEIPAGILGPLLLLCMGRRPLSIASYTLSGLSLLAILLVPAAGGYDWLRLALPLAAKFGIVSVFSSAYLLMPEALPTTIRNAGYGFVSMVGKVGGVVAPYIGMLSEVDAAYPPLLLGLMSVAAGLLCFCLPETRGVELPEDLHDTDPGPFLAMFGLRRKEKEAVEMEPLRDREKE